MNPERAASSAPSPPLVSVVLVSRDRERYVQQALDSLAAQTYAPLELILVDDGSRDGTRAILERFAATHPNARVIVLGGVGPAAARARAFETARGSLFALQDDDDLSDPRRLERQVGFLSAHPDVALVGTATEVIDEHGASLGLHPLPLDDAAIRAELARKPAFVHGSILMRREAYETAGGYRAVFHVVEDYDLYLRLPASARLANLPEPLYRWRRHAGNTVAKLESDHFFLLAAVKTFRDERRSHDADSAAALERAASHDAFLASYRLAGTLLAYRGESYARIGRLGDAWRDLGDAWRRGGPRGRTLLWLALAPLVAAAWRVRAMRTTDRATLPRRAR